MQVLEPAIGAELRVAVTNCLPAGWDTFTESFGYRGYFQRSAWVRVLERGLRQQPWFITARRNDDIVGVLPLMFVSGPLFGRFLVSLPYLNTAGLLTNCPDAAEAMVAEAICLADRLDVKHLELRHETEIAHSGLPDALRQKVHMRMPLEDSEEAMWTALKSKVRSQVKKPRNDQRLAVDFGREELLGDFYTIFCANMRDLGTPPFSRALFSGMLDELASDTEICRVQFEGRTVAAAFLVHGPEVTTVPSASSLRAFNHTSCNMLMYWHLLVRAIERGQSTFDFGRSSADSGTYRFKKQWGAVECPAVWQYYAREGSPTDMRPDGGKYDLMIRAWQKLPIWFTRIIGPTIVRGIP